MRRRRRLDLDPQAASLEPDGLEALRERGAIGRLQEQDGVHEVDPAGAGGDRPPSGDGGRVESLALDITDLAPFGRQPLTGANHPQAGRHERHRLCPRERPHAHRDRGDAVDGEQPSEPARPELGRPAAPEMERGDERWTLGEPGLDRVRRPGPGDP